MAGCWRALCQNVIFWTNVLDPMDERVVNFLPR